VTQPGRLEREIEFHRGISDRAEIIWNWDSPSGRRRAARRSEIFAREAGLAPGRRALEVGCGTGIFLEVAARTGAEIVALDLSADLLARARSRVANAATVRLSLGNAEQMPFRDASFDCVYGSSILHHLHLDDALAEVRRVLRPGGRIAFTEPNILNPQVTIMFRLGLTKKYFGVSPDEMAFSRFRAARALRAAGFSGIVVRPFDFLHPSTPARAIEAVTRFGRALESVPLVRELAGSMVITATRPRTQ
jgi:ubiquinone/menaquinone biosynthesis C-methylase UbiE